MLLGPWIDTAQALLILAIESLSSVDVTMKWLWRNAKLSTTQMGGGSDGGVLEWSEGLGLLLQRSTKKPSYGATFKLISIELAAGVVLTCMSAFPNEANSPSSLSEMG
ncbi:hypothetical protein Tco_0317172 [Tanacetum coccineum]